MKFFAGLAQLLAKEGSEVCLSAGAPGLQSVCVGLAAEPAIVEGKPYGGGSKQERQQENAMEYYP